MHNIIEHKDDQFREAKIVFFLHYSIKITIFTYVLIMFYYGKRNLEAHIGL